MKLVVATQNKGKLLEIKAALEPLGFAVFSAADRNIFEDIEENGTTFEENAFIKARRIRDLSGEISIADDSGLLVDFLCGAPGVYTARYAGVGATDDENIEKLLAALKEVPDEKRTARFASVIACAFPDGREFFVSGTCEGVIAHARSGALGFGYDPVFYVPTLQKTFAEMTSEEKNKISHRGRALSKFKNEITKYIGR